MGDGGAGWVVWGYALIHRQARTGDRALLGDFATSITDPFSTSAAQNFARESWDSIAATCHGLGGRIAVYMAYCFLMIRI